MQLWTKVQHDLVLLKINQDLQQKEEAFEQIEATLPTLVLAQCLVRLRTSNTLQDEIKGLCHKKHVIREHLKPWAAIDLQLSQDVDGAMKRLNQTLESVMAVTEGPRS